MKFAVSREDLLKPLQLVTGVVERRQTMPVLSNLCLVVTGQKLMMTGTDLEVQLVAEVDLQAPAEQDGEITVPARKLMDIWRALPDGAQVSFSVDEQRATLKSGRSRFQLATLPAAEFPTLEEGTTDADFTLSQAQLRQLISKTSFSMAQQDVRYFLNGMLLELAPAHIRSVATDGHRLAMCTLTPGPGAGPERQVIVPRKGVLELARLIADGDDPVALSLGTHHLSAKVGGFSFTTKLIDGRFPDYEKVVPQGNTTVVEADRRMLREAFQRAAILSNEKYRGVRLVLSPENLTIQANNPEQEEAEESMPVNYQGPALEIGFNVSYLLEVLSTLEADEVAMQVSDSNSSALLEDKGSSEASYVVMPMRL
jgi:DNA polymerase-3 subunit beta